MPRLSDVREGSCKVRVYSPPEEVGMLKMRDMAGMATSVSNYNPLQGYGGAVFTGTARSLTQTG